MKAKDLRNAVLQLAVQGKLVPQNIDDEPASVLLEKIKAEKHKLINEKKIKKQKDLVPISEEEIVFDIPDSWQFVRLGLLLSVKGGKRIPKGEKLLDKPTKHIYIRVTDMKNGTIISNKLKYLSESTFSLIKNYTISKNDLYLTIAGTIGAVGRVPSKFDNMNLTENAVKLCNISINKDYLFNVILSNYVQNQFIDKTNKVAQPKLAIIRILSTIIPLPPLTEQQRIVDKLEQIMPLIDEYEMMETELSQLETEFPEQLKKSILHYAVQGKLVNQNQDEEPASKLLERIKAEKYKLIKKKKIRKQNPLALVSEDEIPFDIPESWEWVRLGEIIELISGQDKTTSDYNHRGQGVPYITGASNISNNSIILNRWIEKPTSAAYKGDLLLTCKGTVGTTVILCEDLVHIARQIMALRSFSDVTINYIKLFIDYYVETLKANAVSMIPGISRDDVLNIIFPLPPFDEQKHIVEKVDELLKLCDILADEKALRARKIKKTIDTIVELPIDNDKDEEEIVIAACGDVGKRDLDIAEEIFNDMFEE